MKRKSVTLIVRRGALRRFDRLKRDTRGLPVDVIWDRRQADRRTDGDKPASDQRQAERRKQSHFIWDVADFVVVESDADEAEKKK